MIFRASAAAARGLRRPGAAQRGESRCFPEIFWVIRMDSSIWDQVLGRIETKVNRHSFYTWFRPTSFVANGGGSITVRVPNQLFKDWLTKHYSLVLAEALAEVGQPGVSVLFVTGETSAVQPSPEIAPASDAFELEPPPATTPATAPGGLNPRY